MAASSDNCDADDDTLGGDIRGYAKGGMAFSGNGAQLVVPPIFLRFKSKVKGCLLLVLMNI